MSDLAPDAIVPSPRLLWMAEHRLRARDYGASNPHGAPRWACFTAPMTRIGLGDTEFDAELDWAIRNEIEHWAVSTWNKAMR